MPEIFAFFLYLSFITFINYNLIKKNHKYFGNSNLFTICILSLLFFYLYTIYIYIKISSLKRKFEKIEQQEQEAAKQNERIEKERIERIEREKERIEREKERIERERKWQERIEKERIERERKEREYLKSPAVQEERKLVFENLVTITGLSENIINCLFDQYPTKNAIINSSIEALAEVPGISNGLAKAIHARLKNI